MKRRLLWYRLGLLQTLAMGLYHFYLPLQWQWPRVAHGLPPTIYWALFALNNYFSFLLVAASVLSWWARDKGEAGLGAPLLPLGFASFWLFAFGYQMLWPMPLPDLLAWLRLLLPGIALGNAVLFLLALRGSGGASARLAEVHA